MPRHLAVWIAVVSVGCSESVPADAGPDFDAGSAIHDEGFLLEIDAPPSEDATRYAVIQIRDAATHSFEIPWAGGELTYALEPDRSFACLRLVDGMPGADLAVSVRLCESESCLALPDADPPQMQIAIGRPFYDGRRTYTRRRWEDTADMPVIVDACEVEGCIDGTASTYCAFPSGDHFCVDGADVERGHSCPADTPTVMVGP